MADRDRLNSYLQNIAEGESAFDEPRTEKEVFLANIANGDENTRNANTREEYWLKQIEGGAPHYDAADLGKVVAFENNQYDLIDQSERSEDIIQNGTYDTTYNNKVTVRVPQGYTRYITINGTLANPWGDYTFESIFNLVSEVVSCIVCFPNISFDATAIGAGRGNGRLHPIGNNLRMSDGDVLATNSLAFTIYYDSAGLVSAYMESNGNITDISPYASLITTTVFIPMTSDE